MCQGHVETYINVFFSLAGWSFVAAAAIVLVIWLVKRFAVGWSVAAAI